MAHGVDTWRQSNRSQRRGHDRLLSWNPEMAEC